MYLLVLRLDLECGIREYNCCFAVVSHTNITLVILCVIDNYDRTLENLEVSHVKSIFGNDIDQSSEKSVLP
jgi:hypothetical protein